MPSHLSSDGTVLNLTGKSTKPIVAENIIKNWTHIKHPDYPTWTEDEIRQRASFIATRKSMVKFLVAHRHEEATDSPSDLRRAGFGYGIGLNKAYLNDIMGHVRGADVMRDWGPLGGPEDADIPDSPTDGTVGELMFADVTADGVSWDNFFGGTVLEWSLSSPGGFVLVDLPSGEFETMAEALLSGQRPFYKFIPMSWVWDYSRSAIGYRWIKLFEVIDDRVPNPDAAGRAVGDTGLSGAVVLYELEDDGSTRFSRWDMDGELLFEVNMGLILDRQGTPMLPLIPVKFGEHPDIDALGAGLLTGLEDIVIDMFNTVSETREAYRDSAFALWSYRGDDYDTAKVQMASGSRLVNLGGSEDAELLRVGADVQEIDAGLNLLQLGLSAWALAARRKAADAVHDAAAARSGIALQAEFQLDLKPLLVAITEMLNDIEVTAMFVAAQLWGETPEAAAEVQVDRNKQYRLEEEASRIARILEEFVATIPLPTEVKVQSLMAWLEHSDVFDLDEKVEGSDQTLREQIEEEAREMFDSEQEEQKNRSAAFEADMQNVQAQTTALQNPPPAAPLVPPAGGGSDEE